jgi:predicted nuclease of predicted toxin-antitoxin system
LPKTLSDFLVYKGFDAVHTIDLPQKNATDDVEIISLSILENRIVITKDSDFLDSYLLNINPKN